MTEDEAAPDMDARTIDIEVTVSGTPTQVWEAIATGPGVSAWMQPTEIEPRPNGRYSFDLLDGAGPNDSGAVADYRPPHRFATAGVQWSPASGAPPVELATEWTVRTRDDHTCVVRIVMSGFGHGQAWDDEIEGMTGGMRRSLAKLADFLRHGSAAQPATDRGDSSARLASCTVGPVIPVSDLDASITFYRDTLGLAGETAPSGYRLKAAEGSVIYLLAGTDYAGRAGWPLASFSTKDLERTVADLSQRGVATMRDVPYSVDDSGIAELDGMRIAWITDPDDQVISLFELTAIRPLHDGGQS